MISKKNIFGLFIAVTFILGFQNFSVKEVFAQFVGNKVILNVTPKSGISPLTVTTSFFIEGNCTSYEIDFGDGAQNIKTFNATQTENCPSIKKKQFKHTYTTTGNYIIRLKSGKVPFLDLTLSTQQEISIYDGQDTLEVVGGKIGKAPFNVNFKALVNGEGSCSTSSYQLDFGDGETQNITVSAGTASAEEICNRKTKNISHTYSTIGTFTAKLKKGNQIIKSHIFHIGDANNCPIIPKPNCNFEEKLISTGIDRDGCDTGWQCINREDLNTLCPLSKKPSCKNNEIQKTLGWINGCYIGWKCIKDNQVQSHQKVTCTKPEKPNIIECRKDGGIIMDKGRDEHGCWLGFQCNILPGDSNYNPPIYNYSQKNGNSSYWNNKNRTRVRNLRSRGNSSLGKSLKEKFRLLRNLKSQKKGVNSALKFKSNISKSQLKLKAGATLKERLQYLRNLKSQKRKIIKPRLKDSGLKLSKNKFSQNRRTRGNAKRTTRSFNFKKYSSEFRRYKQNK